MQRTLMSLTRKEQMMSEDLIKRSDAAEVVYKALKTPPLKGVLTDTMSLAIAMVRDIPSADRPQGEWIHAHVGTIAEGDYCSNCGKVGYGSKFCPHCGAHMKGADDETAND